VSVAVLGEALIDMIAQDDGSFRPHLGGSPYNVAIGLARQGIEVSYLSPLSDDTFGDHLHKSLLEEHVAVPIARRSLWPTSLAFVTIDDKGLPAYRLYREGVADKDVSFDELKVNVPDDLELFHTGSLALTPSQLPMIRQIFKMMRDEGVVISIDINIRLRASIEPQAYLNGVRSLIGEANIVKASDEDLDALGLHENSRNSAEILFSEMGGGLLLLTEGGGGAVLYTNNGTVERKAYPVVKIRDTVGAGDTFHSAFLASLCRLGNISKLINDAKLNILGDALDFACAAAAINVSRTGCSPPSGDEVRRFIDTAKQG